MTFVVKQAKVPLKRAKTKVENADDGDESSQSTYKLKSKKEPPKPIFYVSDQFGNFFCGYKDAYPYWSPKISEAKELTEDSHFTTLIRWEKGIRLLKQEYL